ncbi:LAQU0S05e01904g1_1 [Lachancea quebecensis]|uniref:ATPase expression protein 1 n=1 Tax=Lachancea quebecensis TaxID=1654605 RepID=A0A0P1KRD5_9SACH|nr:LAQU0S05e01904g1_1 [Lachancea quebecensis]
MWRVDKAAVLISPAQKMGSRMFSSRRLYSALSELKIDAAIPKNPNKRTHDGSFRKFKRVVPAVEDSMHPFYSPNVMERAILCASETKPELLDGQPVVPAVIKHLKSLESTLVSASWQPESKQCLNYWLKPFREMRKKSSPLKLIDSHEIDIVLRSSKIDPGRIPELQKFALMFENEDMGILSATTIGSLIDRLISDQGKAVFSEEVFLYILQHYCKSGQSIASVAHSISEFLHKDIDDLKTAETLLAHVLMTLRRNSIQVAPTVSSAVFKLIDAISTRFHRPFCVLDFSPAVVQMTTEFYVDSGLLKESKVLFTDMINKERCPKAELVEKYLGLIENVCGISTSNNDFLKKYVYISNFRPIFQTVMTPQIAEFLISYCRHFDEVLSLLELVDRSKVTKQIWDLVLPQMIRRVSILTKDSVKNCCHLTILYQRASSFYGKPLSTKVNKAFIIQYAVNGNFAMVVRLLGITDPNTIPSFYASVLAAYDQSDAFNMRPPPSKTILKNKNQFMTSLIIPHYSELPPVGKQLALKHADSEELLEQVLRAEIAIRSRGGKSLLPQVLLKAQDCKFVSIVTETEKYLQH